jgi:hypothetical protein
VFSFLNTIQFFAGFCDNNKESNYPVLNNSLFNFTQHSITILLLHYVYSYYGLYKIVRSSPSCEQEDAPEWTKLLATKGTVVCVECQQYAMRKHLGERCHGHGSTQRETRWEASNGCRGTWQLISEHEAGSCEGDRDTSFILL